MDDPRARPSTGDFRAGSVISAVQKMESPEGSAYGFSVLDQESMTPCFRLAFESAQDAERGRAMMEEIIDNALWYDVPPS